MKNIYDDEDFFLAYSQMARSQYGLEGAGEWYLMKTLIGDVQGQTVLDLGCGYGWQCAYLAKNGAKKVVGIDGSEKMLAKAKAINHDEKITYLLSNLERYNYPKQTYDVVLSNLVLHYLEDLKAIYQKIYATLKDDGIFVFNIEHPAFTAGVNQDWIYDEDGKALYWPVDNYYYPGLRETNFLGKKVYKYHHTLTQIINDLISVGFEIEALQEAMPDVKMKDEVWFDDEMRRPMMLLVRAKKVKK